MRNLSMEQWRKAVKKHLEFLSTNYPIPPKERKTKLTPESIERDWRAHIAKQNKNDS